MMNRTGPRQWFYWLNLFVFVLLFYSLVRFYFDAYLRSGGFGVVRLMGGWIVMLAGFFYVPLFLYFLVRRYHLKHFIIPFAVFTWLAAGVLLMAAVPGDDTLRSMVFALYRILQVLVYVGVIVFSILMLCGKVPVLDFSLPVDRPVYPALILGLGGLFWQIGNLSLIVRMLPFGKELALPGLRLEKALGFCPVPTYIDFGSPTLCQVITTISLNLVLYIIVGYIIGKLQMNRDLDQGGETQTS